MNVLLWILAALLTAVFLTLGVQKLTQSREMLAANPNMAWVELFSPAGVKIIGVLEVLAAVGLTLPALLDIAVVLVPIAATGVVLLMVGAGTIHLKRGESPVVLVNAVLLVLAAVVAGARFGPYSF